MLIVDLRHWLLPDGSLVPEARLAPHIALIVECATNCFGDGMTTMVCRHRDTRRQCDGLICIANKEGTLHWACASCADGGVITGWQGTRWDLSEVEIAPEDEEHGLYLPLDELRALRDLELAPTVRATLAGAMQVGERDACAPLTESELASLVAAISGADVRGRAQRRLDRALGRAEQVLIAHQLERRARAH